MLTISMLIYAVVASFTPGPNNIMALFFSQNFNFKSSLRFSIGVGLGFLFLLLLSNIFNTTMHAVFPKIELLMKIFAFIYLLYLAFKISMSSIYGTKQTFNHKLSGLKSGVMLQFINPKGIIYALTVISTFITPFYTHWLEQLPFIILLAIIGFFGTLSWGILGTLFKSLIAAHERLFNFVMAGLLVYVALNILIH
ncbi:lysine transporter LysE [Staphylococcus cohnii]|uniref:LysE family transporter n=1 Tax=Staphylococcus cohnii TaxID=29382 RepID=UPI001CC90C87|nr:LysE family transporter [Staphylococcus cohnii]MBZ8171710.1 lysine transporter LysE [Staphylococcus cohnii]